LILTFFYRFMPELIYEGNIYIANPPLYGIKTGKSVSYVFSDKELTDYLATLEKKSYVVQRYKGLGEMNAEQLWETTMDPANRKLVQVNVEDAILADKLFSMLMGDDVEERRAFIEMNSSNVKRLDV
jgi:DNA gyrase subunit B